jgi:glucose-6-phosphate 1-dehydrogenase
VRLIHDALTGDRSLFTRPDGLAAVWKSVGPLLADRPRVVPYAPGSWGPAKARELIAPGRWLLGQ